jgi:hypothetical protein
MSELARSIRAGEPGRYAIRVMLIACSILASEAAAP